MGGGAGPQSCPAGLAPAMVSQSIWLCNAAKSEQKTAATRPSTDIRAACVSLQRLALINAPA